MVSNKPANVLMILLLYKNIVHFNINNNCNEVIMCQRKRRRKKEFKQRI